MLAYGMTLKRCLGDKCCEYQYIEDKQSCERRNGRYTCDARTNTQSHVEVAIISQVVGLDVLQQTFAIGATAVFDPKQG